VAGIRKIAPSKLELGAAHASCPLSQFLQFLSYSNRIFNPSAFIKNRRRGDRMRDAEMEQSREPVEWIFSFASERGIRDTECHVSPLIDAVLLSAPR
jgi:hypothetical protein